MDTRARPMGPVEWSLLVALALLWAGSFFFAKIAVTTLPPLTVVLARVGIAAVALNLLLVGSGRRMPADLGIWAAFVAMGLLNNLIPFSLIFWGQTRIGSGLASILNATTPLWTVVVAHLSTRDERMTAGKLAGVAAGIAGVAALLAPTLSAGAAGDLAAMAAVVGAALSYAAASVFGRRFARMAVPPFAVASGQLTATTAMMLPVVAIVDAPWMLPVPGVEVWASLVALALLSTALAYVIYFRILATAGATNLMLVTLLIPPGAVALGAVFLGELISPEHLVGFALIGVGLALIDGRLIGVARRLSG
ncbi:MAG: DMT family transporter [Rhodospirillales bacterium]|nr:MAG: DMT family transporter [Rhodospirillales bacterium]